VAGHSFDVFDGSVSYAVSEGSNALVFFLFRLLNKLQSLGTVPAIDWNAYAEQLSIVVLLGLLLFAAYIIFIRATFRSIGLFGVILVAAIISAGLWVMFDNGLLTLQNQTSLTWIGLVALAFVLALGMYWSHVRRSLSGQSDVDDIDE
jgi:hypothetical protein